MIERPKSVIPWVWVLLGVLVALPISHGDAAQRITFVANRDDISFAVQLGAQRFDIETVLPLSRQGSDRFEWQFDEIRLLEALKAEFGFNTREIAFSELCARLTSSGMNQEQRTCVKFATLKAKETFHFYFYPADKVEISPKDIYIIDSECIIIGNDNQAHCE